MTIRIRRETWALIAASLLAGDVDPGEDRIKAAVETAKDIWEEVLEQEEG